MAAMRVTKGLLGSRSTNNNIKRKTAGPSHNPILLRTGDEIGSAISDSAVLVIVQHFYSFLFSS
jgi:hypothetical protein